MNINNKIKIVHVVGGINYGGVEAVLKNYFSILDKEKYELTIISHEKSNLENKKELEKLGFEIYEVPSKKENLLENLKQLYKIIKKVKPQIVHCHLTLSNYAPLFIAWLLKIRIRISHSHLSYENKSFSQKIYCILSNLFANNYMACSKKAAIYLFGKKKYNKNKVYILNNAIDIEKFKYNEDIRNKVRNKLNISNNNIIIGNVGRFHEQKNHDLIVKIFNKVHKQNSLVKLLLIGNGELQEKIKKQVQDLNLENQVMFIEATSEINEYYQAMDMFLFPSLYEGLGMALVEAQMSGLKCIASNTVPKEAKITNLVQFLDLNDNIEKWSEKILNEIGNKCNRKIELEKHNGYDIKEEAKKLENFYKDIINERGKDSGFYRK